MSHQGAAPSPWQVHVLAGAVAAIALGAAAQWLLPRRFLSDQAYFDGWRIQADGAQFPGRPFERTAQFYDVLFGWTSAPIEAQAVLLAGAIGALAGLVWHRADRRGRFLLLAGTPFLVAFMTPAGKEQILALAMAPLIIWKDQRPRWLLLVPLVAFSIFIRTYWLLPVAAFALGFPRSVSLSRGRWLALCLAGITLMAGVAFATSPGFDWREYAAASRGVDNPADHDTEFHEVPSEVTGFSRGILNSAFAAWQIVTFRPVQGLLELQQWGGYAGLAIIACAWFTVRRGPAPSDLLVTAYPVILGLQLWFEPDLGSLVRHQVPFLLLIGAHGKRPRTAADFRWPHPGAWFVGFAFGLLVLYNDRTGHGLAAALITAAAAAVLTQVAYGTYKKVR